MNRRGQIFVKYDGGHAVPKIRTIKAVRHMTGMSLTEAKEVVESGKEVPIFEGTAKEVAKEIVKLRRQWPGVNFYTQYTDPEELTDGLPKKVKEAMDTISAALDDIVSTVNETTGIAERDILAEIAFQATSRYRNTP